MTTIIKKKFQIAALAFGATAVLFLTAFSSFATPAYALTEAEATTIIQILGLTGSQAAVVQSLVTSNVSGGYTFTRNLTIGSRGPDVTYLQQSLISLGFSIPAITSGVAAPGYFGTQTQAAVAAWQASRGVTPAVGYFGPISQASWSAMTSSTGGGGTTGGTTGGVVLHGGAGSLSEAQLVGNLNNEKVGEGEDDVPVAGLNLQADQGSDIMITAVTVNFSKGTASRDFRKYAQDVSVWLNGTEYARVSADQFTSDNGYSRTISLKTGAVIKANAHANLVVAVSGINNLDSSDTGKTWTVSLDSVRFQDAQGASVTDSSTGDIGTTRTFSFNTFATAQGVELRASASNATPQGVLGVSDTSDTNGVELLRFTLQARGGDIRVRDIPITFATSSGDTATRLSDIASAVYLDIGNQEYSENTSSAVAGSSGDTVTFSDADYTISEGNTVTVVVKADINNVNSSDFTDGDKLTASYTADDRVATRAEDQSGEDLASSDKTGTGLGREVAFYNTGINVSFVSASESVTTGSGANDDAGTFVIKFHVEAFNDTVYISDSADATTATTPDAATSAANEYRVTRGTTAITSGVSSVVTFTTNNGARLVSGNIELQEGESTDMTLSVSHTNSMAGDAGLYQASLEGIKWNTSNNTTAGNGYLYTFNLDDYHTDPITLN